MTGRMAHGTIRSAMREAPSIPQALEAVIRRARTFGRKSSSDPHASTQDNAEVTRIVCTALSAGLVGPDLWSSPRVGGSHSRLFEQVADGLRRLVTEEGTLERAAAVMRQQNRSARQSFEMPLREQALAALHDLLTVPSTQLSSALERHDDFCFAMTRYLEEHFEALESEFDLIGQNRAELRVVLQSLAKNRLRKHPLRILRPVAQSMNIRRHGTLRKNQLVETLTTTCARAIRALDAATTQAQQASQSQHARWWFLCKSWWMRHGVTMGVGMVGVFATIVGIVLTVAPTPASVSDTNEARITIGGKHFLESSILVELMALAVEHNTDPPIRVTRRHNHRETVYCKDAVLDGDIDGYPEYTGTILSMHLGLDLQQCRERRYLHEPDEIQRALDNSPNRLSGLQWLGDFGLHNGYTLVMRRDRIEELGLDPESVSITEVANVGQAFSIAGNPEALERDDCIKGLIWAYDDLQFNRYVEITGHHGLYDLLLEREDRARQDDLQPTVDMVIGYTTDTQLRDDRFVELRDDEDYFVFYYAGPLFRKDVLARFENHGLQQALETLQGAFGDRTTDPSLANTHMRDLLARVEKPRDALGGQLITPATLNPSRTPETANTRARMALRRIVREWMLERGLLAQADIQRPESSEPTRDRGSE